MEGSMGNQNQENKRWMIRNLCKCASLDSGGKMRMGVPALDGFTVCSD
jgi:hypothetical protein